MPEPSEPQTLIASVATLAGRRLKIAVFSQPEYFRFMYEHELETFADVFEFKLQIGLRTTDFKPMIEFKADYNFFFRGEYFPSSDDVAFSRGTDYHWLHNSFEHLLYPSEMGIRALLKPLFGANVLLATFLTRQGPDVIPYGIVVAIKGEVVFSAQTAIAELFRQLTYLNDRTCFDMDASRGAGALAPTWGGAGDVVGPEGDVPYVAGVLSAKFGNLEAARLFLCEGDYLEKLDSRRLTDLLVIALHGGSIDWLRTNLPVILPRITMALIASDCSMVVERYDAQHPKTEVASSERLMNEGHGK
jgi:hypothetical protein